MTSVVWNHLLQEREIFFLTFSFPGGIFSSDKGTHCVLQTTAVAFGPEMGRKEIPPSDLVENLTFGDGFLLHGQKQYRSFLRSMWKTQNLTEGQDNSL